MVNTVFNLIDSNGNQIYSKIYISPALTPMASGSNVVTNDSVIVTENKSSVTVSLIPSTYNVRLVGSNTKTAFIINLPQQANGTTVNASDYMVSVIPSVNYNAATASFAQFANSSSFAQTASFISGGGTSLTTGSTYPITASVALNSVSTSFAPYQVSSSYANTASFAITASYAPQQTVTTVPSASWASQSLSASYVKNAVSASFVPAIGQTFAVQLNGGGNFTNGKLTGSTLIYRFGKLGVGTGTAYVPLYDVDVLASSGTTSTIGSLNYNVDLVTGVNNPDQGRFAINLKAYEVSGPVNDITKITIDRDIILMPQSSSYGGTFFGDSTGTYNVGIGDFLNPNVYGMISMQTDTYIAAYDSANDKFIYTSLLSCNTSTNMVETSSPLTVDGELYVLGGGGLIVDNGASISGNITASGVVATNLQQLPHSSSVHSLTPYVNTGSMYFKVSGSTNLMFVYNGLKWVSSSMA